MSELGDILHDFNANQGASAASLDAAEAALGFELPYDYREFMRRRNGGEGFFGEHYLILWRGEELAPFNKDYQVTEYAPGLILFGSTGGGDGFAFDTRQEKTTVVQVPFIGLSLRDARHVAGSLTELLERMSVTSGSLF